MLRRTLTGVIAAATAALGTFLFVEPAHAATTWYVAATGADTAACPGTQAQPCRTITRILNKGAAVVDGDTIIVGAGTYTERPIFNKSVTVNGAGQAAVGGTVITNAGQNNTTTVTVATANKVVTLNDVRITGGLNNVSQFGGGIRVGVNTQNVASTLNLNNVTVTGNTSTAGGGALVWGGGTLNATNSTFSGNTSAGANAGGGGVYNLGTTTITGGTVSGNTVSGSGSIGGGGVYAAAGSTTINGTTISGNSAPLGGGVAAVALTATNVTFQNNTGTAGGGGLLTNVGTINVAGSSFTGNTSPLGAGLYVAGGTTNVGNATANSGGTWSGNNAATNGGAAHVVTGGTLNVNNASMTGNSGGATATGTNGGGALSNLGTLSVANSLVKTNTTANWGGAVYNKGTATVSGSTLQDNQALQGGGVYNEAPGTVSLSGSTVTANKTAGAVGSTQGGGIVSTGAVNLTSGSAVTGNTTGNQGGGIAISGPLTMTGSSVTGNTAGVIGGGIVATGTSTVTGGSVSNNTAPNAGAMYNLGNATFDGTTVSNNTGAGGTLSSGGNAGAFYNVNALTLKNATLTGNKVTVNTNATPGITGYGGAILQVTLVAAVTPQLTLTDTAINGGAVGGADNAAIGGGIATYPNTVAGGTTGKITGTGLTLSKNIAAAGGGIYTPGQLTLTNSTLDQNKATHASNGIGGAIFAGSSPIVLDNTDVTANTAAAQGGGLYVVAGSTTEIRNGSTLSGNSAPIGGAVTAASTMTVKDSSISGNSASFAGAGLVSSGVTTVQDTNVDDNTATSFAGGIATGAGNFTMTGGTVNGNDAVVGAGVVVAKETTAVIDGTSLNNNVATGGSGGAIASAGKLTVKNATLSGNTASADDSLGAAIFSGSNDPNVATTLKIDGTTISGNDAFGAPAIAAHSTGSGSTSKTSITNSTIANNSATTTAGAIFQTGPMSITNTTVTGNTATGAGAVGALVLFNRAATSLSGVILADNTGPSCYKLPADNGNPVDGGYNHGPAGDTSCGFSGAKHDQSGDPKLGALAGNGGPSFTRLPAPDSPVLDKIPASTATGAVDAISGAAITLCAAGVDQRGTARPQGAKCDIGSVEKVQVAPTIDGPTDADWTVGAAITPLTYTTTGSPQPTLGSTALPNGLTFTDNGDGTGTISGTPATGSGGNGSVTVTATNEAGNDSIVLDYVVRESPKIDGPDADTYTVGQSGGPTTFTQNGGNPLGTFSSNGLLPNGVTFDAPNPGSGSYSGTPGDGSGGIYHLTVTNDNGTPPAATKNWTLTVNESPELDGPAAVLFKVGTAGASDEFIATGFPAPTLSQTGLPAGLGIASTGAGKATLQGTAANNTGGVYPVTVTADNGIGSAASKNVTVTVNEAPELAGPISARWVTGEPNSIGFSSNGFPQATVSFTGTLPGSLTFAADGNGGATISGTANAGDIGTYVITVKAANGVSPDATQQVTIEVVPPVQITTTSLPNAAHKSLYSAQVAASGGQPAYTFSITAGSLPAGLTMSSTGLIQGSTTASPGTYTFTVKVADSLDPVQTSTKQLSITVVKGVTQLTTKGILLGTGSNSISIKLGFFEADLKGGFPLQPVAGETVTFKQGNKTVCSAKTDVNGHVKCAPDILTALVITLSGQVTGHYAGSTNWLPATSTAGLIGPN